MDVACGVGRNALFWAEKGFSVTAVDVSETALSLLNEAARQRHLIINTQQIDLESGASLPEGSFDLLLNFFFLHRPLLSQELARVRPGGVAVIRTFSRVGAGQSEQISAAMSLASGELLKIFSGWKILLHGEGLEPSKKRWNLGRNRRPTAEISRSRDFST